MAVRCQKIKGWFQQIPGAGVTPVERGVIHPAGQWLILKNYGKRTRKKTHAGKTEEKA